MEKRRIQFIFQSLEGVQINEQSEKWAAGKLPVDSLWHQIEMPPADCPLATVLRGIEGLFCTAGRFNNLSDAVQKKALYAQLLNRTTRIMLGQPIGLNHRAVRLMRLYMYRSPTASFSTIRHVTFAAISKQLYL